MSHRLALAVLPRPGRGTVRHIVTTAVLVIGVGCAGRPNALPSPGAMAFDDARVRRVVQAALDAEATGSPVDTLYLSQAVIVSNGRARHAPPRFAGIAPGGTVRVLETLVEITSALAWVSTRYQWLSDGSRSAEGGRATFVLVPVGGEWKIRHVHSSTVLPWESEP